MPNKRSDQKRIISAYVEDDLKAALLDIAKKEGKTLTDVVTEMITERIDEHVRARNDRDHSTR